jgi:cell division protease FtsH
MDKKRPFRFRYTLRYGIVAAIAICAVLYFVFARESNVVTIGYGAFKQMLQAPGAQFTELRVGPTTIRGKVTFTDQVAGAAVEPARTPISFRTSRHGVENDPTLYPLLDTYAPGFEAEGEKSVVAVMMEIVVYLILLVFLTLVVVLIARRWLGMGGPFGFGRGRHRLYGDVDRRITFQDVAGIEEAKAELK